MILNRSLFFATNVFALLLLATANAQEPLDAGAADASANTNTAISPLVTGNPEAEKSILEISRMTDELSKATDTLTETEKLARAIIKVIADLKNKLGNESTSELSQLYKTVDTQLLDTSHPVSLRLQMVTASGDLMVAADAKVEEVKAHEKSRLNLQKEGKKVFQPVDNGKDSLEMKVAAFEMNFKKPSKEQIIQLALARRVLELANAKIEAYEGTDNWDDKLENAKNDLKTISELSGGIRDGASKRLREIVEADLNPATASNIYEGMGLTALRVLVKSAKQGKADLVALMTFMNTDQDNAVRRQALHAIASLGDDAIGELRIALESPDPYLRAMASHELTSLAATSKKPGELRKAVTMILANQHSRESASSTEAAISALRQLASRMKPAAENEAPEDDPMEDAVEAEEVAEADQASGE